MSTVDMTALCDYLTATLKCADMSTFFSQECAFLAEGMPGSELPDMTGGVDISTMCNGDGGGFPDLGLPDTGLPDTGLLGRRLLQDVVAVDDIQQVDLSSEDFTKMCLDNRKCLDEFYSYSTKMMSCMNDAMAKLPAEYSSGETLPDMPDMSAMMPDADIICAQNPLSGDFCFDVMSEVGPLVESQAITECDALAKVGCCASVMAIDAEGKAALNEMQTKCGITVDACGASTAVTPIDFDLGALDWSTLSTLTEEELDKLQLQMQQDLADSLGVLLTDINVEVSEGDGGKVKVEVKVANADSELTTNIDTKIQATDWTKTSTQLGADATIDTSAVTSKVGETQTVEQAPGYTDTTVGAAPAASATAGVLALCAAFVL